MTKDTIEREPSLPNIDEKVTCSLLPGKTVPLFIAPRPGMLGSLPAFIDWTRQHRTILDALILQFGGIVLRGFPLATPEHFSVVSELFPAYGLGYTGGQSPRKTVTGKVMEATQLAGNLKIFLHQEMAYMNTYPPRIAFFCVKPAETGGETIIGPMREVTERLSTSIRERLEKHGVRGIRNYAPVGSSEGKPVTDHPDNRPWDHGFGTDDCSQVEATCASMRVEPHWNDDGSLTVVSYTDGVTTHPVTGERFYRTILHTTYSTYDRLPGGAELRQKMIDAKKLPTGYAFGNGEEITSEEAEAIHAIFQDVEVRWPWQRGDVMILDNLQVAHGRSPFTGERETLVALLD
jgi:alpha-ketoglutarate-dependent taurine dioxygenase